MTCTWKERRIECQILNVFLSPMTQEYDGELLKKSSYVHSQRIWDPEFFLAEAQRLFKMALSNQLEEALLECDLNMFKSFIYPMTKGGVIAGLCVSSLDRVSK